MENFWEFLKLAMLYATIFWGLFIILLSLPGSRLRQILMNLYSKTCYAITILLGLYIVSPVDLIPDIIIGLGQVDDAVALVGAFFTGLTGLVADYQMRKSSTSTLSQ